MGGSEIVGEARVAEMAWVAPVATIEAVAVVPERLFERPGLGTSMLNAYAARDLPHAPMLHGQGPHAGFSSCVDGYTRIVTASPV
jgi:hypothetical protein